MTRRQVAESLGFHINYVHAAFEAARKRHPELDEASMASSRGKGTGADYTLEQVLLAMSYLRGGRGISDIEKAVLADDFSMRQKEKARADGIDGTDEFLRKVRNFPRKKCCSTCSFCTKSTMRNRKPVLKPYCKLWGRFLHRLGANPYNDWCRQWEFSGKAPLVFYRGGSPVNVDIYGNVRNEVMGFDVSLFGKKSSKDISLVTDAGFEGMTVPEE